jgi:hypothetical protein
MLSPKTAVQEQISPTIQYFIAKINNERNLDGLKLKALAFIKSINFETSNEADKYFFQLQSNLFMAENVRQGGSGGVHGMHNQLLSYYEMCAISYVKKLLLSKTVDNLTPEMKVDVPSLVSNKSSFWSNDAIRTAALVTVGVGVMIYSLSK